MSPLQELNKIISLGGFEELASKLAQIGSIDPLNTDTRIRWRQRIWAYYRTFAKLLAEEVEMDRLSEEAMRGTESPENVERILREAGEDPEKVAEQGRVFVNTLVAKIKLEQQVENLKSVMVAAAEEIQEHWQAHCDEEGYGPSNLMHRLERGLGADYSGYKPGAFKKLQDEVEELKRQLATR